MTAEIDEFCRTVVSSASPSFVPLRTLRGSTRGNCHLNVREVVRQKGGKIVFGWAIWEWSDVLIEAEYHSVWRNGDDLVDVTPNDPGINRVLFLPDPVERFDLESRKLVRNRRKPLARFPVSATWIAAVERLEAFVDAGPSSATATARRNEENRLLQDVQQAHSEIFLALAEVTHRNASCFCNSGRRFEVCCSPLVRRTD